MINGKKEKEEGIAQPIILFRFWSITNLAVSIIGRNITRLRFRIPGRNLTDSLTNNLNNSIKYESIKVGRQDFKLPILPFPSLKFLDIQLSQLIFPVRSGGGFESELERVDETLRLIGLTCQVIWHRLPLKNQRIPEKVTVIPSKSNLKCISIGTDLSSSSSSSYGSEEDLKEEKKTRERWIDQFRLGWFDGISKLEITVREKLDEHLRAIDSWNKSIVKLQDSFDDDDDGHADELGLDDQRNHLQESFERLVDCKPVMITTSSSFANNLNHHHNDDNKEGNQSEINSDTVFQKFIKSQDLTEISITQVEDLLLNLSLLKTQSLGAEGPPILLWEVAWKASSSKDLPVKLLSTKSERLIDVDLPDSGGSGQDDLHALFRDLTLHDHQNQTQTQNHFSFTSNLHPLNCAHTEARQ
ncbi:hypothetical protein KEM48_005550, partial [Puccinia striiformis f. sp. tritici PST-130]